MGLTLDNLIVMLSSQTAPITLPTIYIGISRTRKLRKLRIWLDIDLTSYADIKHLVDSDRTKPDLGIKKWKQGYDDDGFWNPARLA